MSASSSGYMQFTPTCQCHEGVLIFQTSIIVQPHWKLSITPRSQAIKDMADPRGFVAGGLCCICANSHYTCRVCNADDVMHAESVSLHSVVAFAYRTHTITGVWALVLVKRGIVCLGAMLSG